ncbi:Hypothetical Protein FCC1311_090022 [Hondaea fermentalgiana]|uniref:Uncharacterized protein n=1 Tax=Hondaea fermentalgiana TaxID=2315210 RepID=A0A2R5GPI2_9STRA|nr:Hypothetical Protein FCC1311_090022 [Hondaea fermentalgiana]|eukprot:GBG32777.1 Hypothetical Protein FCC1311_090022 [Hondaea fermentalgiana]
MLSAAGILATPKGSRNRRKLNTSKSYSAGLSSLHHGISDQVGQFLGDVALNSGGTWADIATSTSYNDETSGGLLGEATRRPEEGTYSAPFSKVVSDLISALDEEHSIKDSLFEFFDGLREGETQRTQGRLINELDRNSDENNAFWFALSGVLLSFFSADKLLTALKFLDDPEDLEKAIRNLDRSIEGIHRLIDAQCAAISSYEDSLSNGPGLSSGEPGQRGRQEHEHGHDHVSKLTAHKAMGSKRANESKELVDTVRLTAREKAIVKAQLAKGSFEAYATIFLKMSQLLETRRATCEMYERLIKDHTNGTLADLVVDTKAREQMGNTDVFEGSDGNRMLQVLINNALAELDALMALAQVRYQISSYSLDGTMLALVEARKHVATLEKLVVPSSSGSAHAHGAEEPERSSGSFSGQGNGGPSNAVGPFNITIRPHQVENSRAMNAITQDHFRVAVRYTQRVFNILAAKASLIFYPVLAMRLGTGMKRTRSPLVLKIQRFVGMKKNLKACSLEERVGKKNLAFGAVLVLDAVQCEQQGVNAEDLSNAKESKKDKKFHAPSNQKLQRYVLPTRTPNGFICKPLNPEAFTLTCTRPLCENLGIDSDTLKCKLAVQNCQELGDRTSRDAAAEDADQDTEEGLFEPIAGINGLPIIFSWPQNFDFAPYRAGLAGIILAPFTDCAASATVVREDEWKITYVVRKIDPTVHLAVIYQNYDVSSDQEKKTINFCEDIVKGLNVPQDA